MALTRIVATLVVAAGLALAPPARAAFHVAVIDEVLTSLGGDNTQQFVEIRTLAAGQNVTTNTVIAAFDASGLYLGDLLVATSNVGAGTRYVAATSAFQSAHGFTADFTLATGLPTGGGMVCFGAPGGFAPNPATWNHALVQACSGDQSVACTTNAGCTGIGLCQTNYVDCVAYGTYAGPTNLLTGSPTTLAPDGHSITRLANQNGHDNLSSFGCSDPTPENNAGVRLALASSLCCEGQECEDGDNNPCTNGNCQSGTCVSTARPQPSGCFLPALPKKANIVIRDNTVDTKDTVVAKWVKGADLAVPAFGDPTTTDGYTLCVYESADTTPNLVFKVDAPAGGVCPTKPCWKPTRKGDGFNYSDSLLTPDGARAVNLKAGTGGVSKVVFKGLGPLINVPGAALPLATPVVVQVHGHGNCWQSQFSTTVMNTATLFKAKAD